VPQYGIYLCYPGRKRTPPSKKVFYDPRVDGFWMKRAYMALEPQLAYMALEQTGQILTSVKPNMPEAEVKAAKELHDARSKTPLATAYRVDQKNLHT
jgi:hypothetical protein